MQKFSMTLLTLAVGASMLVAPLGCGKKEGGKSGGDGDDNGDGDGDDTSAPEPVITSAPPAWERPNDCLGVGNSCASGSTDGGCQHPDSACQLEGYVCIPGGSLRSRTMETPYCAAYTCMSFEEASCYCTGVGATNNPNCASPAQLAGLCGGNAVACEDSDECCDGYACLPDAYYPTKRCRQTCNDDDECTTGCCTDSLDTGTKICSQASRCETQCKVEGETECSDGNPNTPTLCCRGTCVESEEPNYAGCRPRCDDSDDCFDTGCCMPFSSGGGFCVDSMYCDSDGNPHVGGTSMCNGGPGCQAGETCVNSENPDFVGCRGACGDGSGCASGCCQPFSNSEDGFCVDAKYCSCGEAGAACGGNNPNCCDDTTCLSWTGGPPYACTPFCTLGSECDTGCCAPSLTLGMNVCSPAQNCLQ